MSAINGGHLLKLDRRHFDLRKPFDRRMYQIGRKHCGDQKQFRIGIPRLLAKSGSLTSVTRFRWRFRHFVERWNRHWKEEDKSLLGYRVGYEEPDGGKGDNAVFTNVSAAGRTGRQLDFSLPADRRPPRRPLSAPRCRDTTLMTFITTGGGPLWNPICASAMPRPLCAGSAAPARNGCRASGDRRSHGAGFRIRRHRAFRAPADRGAHPRRRAKKRVPPPRSGRPARGSPADNLPGETGVVWIPSVRERRPNPFSPSCPTAAASCGPGSRGSVPKMNGLGSVPAECRMTL